MTLGFLRGVWTSCRTAPCQEMCRRKEEKYSRAEERWCVVVPQEEAWMTQSYRLSFNQEERDRGKKEGEADMQATEESGNTPTSVT